MEAIINHQAESPPRRPSLPSLHTRSFSAVTVDSASTVSSPDGRDDEENDYFTTQSNDSQSSLGGVPTIREMSSSVDLEREHRITPISKLPSELLIAIFTKLTHTSDLRNCMLVSYPWALHTVGILWHRPLCNKWHNLLSVVQALAVGEMSFFPYHELVRRLNLSALSDKISDGTVQPFMTCKRVERLTLTNCSKLTDYGVSGLVEGSKYLQALDVSDVESLTDRTMHAVAENCSRLQGLNVTNCVNITDDSLVAIAENCKQLKRLKLNKVLGITDQSVIAVARNCRAILEIDLEGCGEITSESVTALLVGLPHLREFRLSHCVKIADPAFVNLPPRLTFDSLRILDLTACEQVRDEAISRIIPAAPRLRNLVLAKCRHITDRAVSSICKLGKNLHYIHLGHCANLSDNAVIALVKACNRIRYIDLACCSRLTDASVQHLATLPKLRRIGLVKCQNLSDQSIIALAHGVAHFEQGRVDPPKMLSSLERVHLSYCVQLTRVGITALLHNCPRLTHLSLTGVQAFLHDDVTRFCRDAPAEFTHPQRDVFCVFSGEGVHRLREHLINRAAAEAARQDQDPETMPEEPMFEGNESPSADTMSDDEITVDGNDGPMGHAPGFIHHGVPIVNVPYQPRPRPRSLQSFPTPPHVEPPLLPDDLMTRFGPWTPNAPLTPEMRASIGPPHLHLMSSTNAFYPPDIEYDFRSRSPGLDLGAAYDHRARSSSRSGSRRHTLDTSTYTYGPMPQPPPLPYVGSGLRRDGSRIAVDDERRSMQSPSHMMPLMPGRGSSFYMPGPSRPRDLPQMYLRPDQEVSVTEANLDSIMSTIPRSRGNSRDPSRSNSPHISRVSSRSRMSMLPFMQTSSPAHLSSPASGSSRVRPRGYEEDPAILRALMLDTQHQLRESQRPSMAHMDSDLLPSYMVEEIPFPITPATPMSPSRGELRHEVPQEHQQPEEPARDGEDVQMTQ